MSKPPMPKPGKSEQTVCTPKILLDAVKGRLGIANFAIDLAADASNAVTTAFYDEAMNSLIQPWTVGGWGWCNPPFAELGPWVSKASLETILGASTAMLVPASVGSNWWADYVHNHAHVLFLNGRVTFVGHTKPYPKDLALLLYSRAVFGGYEIWPWNK